MTESGGEAPTDAGGRDAATAAVIDRRPARRGQASPASLSAASTSARIATSLVRRAAFFRVRDGYIVLMGVVWLLSALVQLGGFMVRYASGRALLADLIIVGPPLVLQGALAVGTLLRLRTVRVAWIARALLAPLWIFGVATLQPASSLRPGPEVLRSLFALVIAIAAFRSPRNKLAFGMEISDREAEAIYAVHFDNRPARAGFTLGALSIIPGLGFLGLIAIPCAIVGLSRVDPEAWPPVGLKVRAIEGIVLSLLGFLITGVVVLCLM